VRNNNLNIVVTIALRVKAILLKDWDPKKDAVGGVMLQRFFSEQQRAN
jgi:hypothetical protein